MQYHLGKSVVVQVGFTHCLSISLSEASAEDPSNALVHIAPVDRGSFCNVPKVRATHRLWSSAHWFLVCSHADGLDITSNRLVVGLW